MSYPKYRNQKEQHAGAKHGGQRLLPRVFVGEHDREGEKRIDAHPRRERDRIVGIEPHHQGAHGGGYTGGDEYRAGIHSGLAEDDRVDEDDVDHRQKSRHCGNEFGADVRPLLGKAEIPLQDGVYLWSGLPRRRHAFGPLDHVTPPASCPIIKPNAAAPRVSDAFVQGVDSAPGCFAASI